VKCLKKFPFMACGSPPSSPFEYRVQDLSLAVLGRKELDLAEKEMPGLMTLRSVHSASKPFSGVRITGNLSTTVQTAVLIETLAILGAAIRWTSCNILSTQDTAAAALVVGKDGTPESPSGLSVFTWKGESLPEYWDCMYSALTWPDGSGPNQLIDDGGDATLMIHCGYEFEETGAVRAPTGDDSPDFREVLRVLSAVHKRNPAHWHSVAAGCHGVTEETTTGIHRLVHLSKAGRLLFPALNVNDAVSKSKFDNLYGCRHSCIDGLNRATDLMIAGKTALVVGYGDVGKGCAQALRGQGARVIVAEIDPICALQAAMEGYSVRTVSEVAQHVDIVITTTGNVDVVTVDDMSRMKDQVIVGNIGHFDDEVDVAGLQRVPGIVRTNIKPQYDMWTFPDGHSILLLAQGRVMNLACATGHPSFVMSMSFTNQMIAQLEICEKWQEMEKRVYTIDKKLDEMVGRLHLDALDVHLTVLTEKQAAYIGVPVDGPYKSNQYRY
jgi:adenosylhomocysteinase